MVLNCSAKHHEGGCTDLVFTRGGEAVSVRRAMSERLGSTTIRLHKRSVLENLSLKSTLKFVGIDQGSTYKSIVDGSVTRRTLSSGDRGYVLLATRRAWWPCR